MEQPNPAPAGLMRGATIALGVLAFAVVLTAHHIADGDLWAKLALGAHVWLRGGVPLHDTFAFTPTLPEYIDHEWGAGAIMSDNDQGKYFYTLELDQIEDYDKFMDAWLQYQFVASTAGLTVLGRSVVDRTSVSITHCSALYQ